MNPAAAAAMLKPDAKISLNTSFGDIIRSSLSRFEHCSESLIWPIGSHIWSLVDQIHMKS